MHGNIEIIFQSVADMGPSRSIADQFISPVSESFTTRRVPIAEIEGASIGYSFRAIEKLRDSVGPGWLSIVLEGLDHRDPVVIRSMVEAGAYGASVDLLLEFVPLDRLSAYITSALLKRLR